MTLVHSMSLLCAQQLLNSRLSLTCYMPTGNVKFEHLQVLRYWVERLVVPLAGVSVLSVGTRKSLKQLQHKTNKYVMNWLLVLVIGIITGIIIHIIFNVITRAECLTCKKRTGSRDVWAMLEEEDDDNSQHEPDHHTDHRRHKPTNVTTVDVDADDDLDAFC